MSFTEMKKKFLRYEEVPVPAQRLVLNDDEHEAMLDLIFDGHRGDPTSPSDVFKPTSDQKSNRTEWIQALSAIIDGEFSAKLENRCYQVLWWRYQQPFHNNIAKFRIDKKRKESLIEQTVLDEMFFNDKTIDQRKPLVRFKYGDISIHRSILDGPLEEANESNALCTTWSLKKGFHGDQRIAKVKGLKNELQNDGTLELTLVCMRFQCPGWRSM